MTEAVVLISGEGSNLQAFIDAVELGHLPITLAEVISNKADAPGLQRAARHNIRNCCINYRDFDSRLAFDRALIEEIDKQQPDIVILAGFMRILTDEFVVHYANKLVNIHPSLLPKYPGTKTHQRVLDSNEEWHGATVHFVVPEVDAGPIILQARLRVNADDTAENLRQRIHKIEHIIYQQAVRWIAQGRITVADSKTLLDGKESTQQYRTYDIQ